MSRKTLHPKVFQIFRSGVHRDMQGRIRAFNDTELILAAGAYPYAKKRAPLVLGHPANDGPAYGEVQSLFMKNGGLYAQALVDDDLLHLVRSGRYRHVSAAFYVKDHPDSPVPGAYVLRHVGFLGATPPAVKGMAALSFAEPEPGIICFGAPCTFEDERKSIADFAAPPGYIVAEARLKVHKLALEYQRACPGLNYSEAVALILDMPNFHP